MCVSGMVCSLAFGQHSGQGLAAQTAILGLFTSWLELAQGPLHILPWLSTSAGVVPIEVSLWCAVCPGAGSGGRTR